MPRILGERRNRRNSDLGLRLAEPLAIEPYYDVRSWAEIDLDALKFNINNIKEITSDGAQIMPIIKADAYGHGHMDVARVCSDLGVKNFAVATMSEALELREKGFKQDILILGAIDENDIHFAVDNRITLTVFNYDFAFMVSQVAKRRKKIAKMHIKLDTGMSRIGYVVGEDNDEAIADEIINISKLENVSIEGIFTHFSASDEYDKSYTNLQFKRFITVCDMLKGKGLDIQLKHCANSAAIMMYPEMHLNLVRPGIILYGYYPSDEVDKSRLKLKPVMTLKSKITHVKDLAKGRGVSYGKEYVTSETRRIATVPIGYADGYIRAYAKRGYMLVNGRRAKIVGRICMDQCMIDVTDIPEAEVGDEVVIFGSEGITADDLAKWSGSINYEALCLISKRIPRIYV